MTPFDRLRAKHFALRANPDLARDVRRAIRQAFHDGIEALDLFNHAQDREMNALFNKYETASGRAAMKAASKKKVKR